MRHADTSDREIVLTRVLDAPRERVWEAWTTKEHLDRWWGPNGFRNETHSIDVRPGGQWRYTMHGPDGKDYENLIEYKEVTKPERIAYMHGDPTSTDEPFHGSTTFEEAGDGKTKITLRIVFKSPEELKKMIEEVGAIEGGNQTLGRLAEYVKTM